MQVSLAETQFRWFIGRTYWINYVASILFSLYQHDRSMLIKIDLAMHLIHNVTSSALIYDCHPQYITKWEKNRNNSYPIGSYLNNVTEVQGLRALLSLQSGKASTSQKPTKFRYVLVLYASCCNFPYISKHPFVQPLILGREGIRKNMWPSIVTLILFPILASSLTDFLWEWLANIDPKHA